ncbi:tetratricopeptide repeat protein [Alkalinema pantanalense CENA528]|uniref:tetratricopeptide repeat protein n=1 Tax=Alkalinema pantanalense TaxID=1620705 RepID=UPI003D6ED9D2
MNELFHQATGEPLGNLHQDIFRCAWENRTYEEMDLGYSPSHVREAGSRLFRILGQVLGKPVNKRNFRAVLNHYAHHYCVGNGHPCKTDTLWIPRDPEFSQLDALIDRGTKIILIHGEGGLGKTRLVRKYLERRSFTKTLIFQMGSDPEHLTSAKSLVSDWLSKIFGDKAGRDFMLNLMQLRVRLSDPQQFVGILIDDLDTALDGDSRFVPDCRDYVQLLETLSDPDIKAVTFLVSRTRLHEERLELDALALEGLPLSAWQDYFQRSQLSAHTPALAEMWQTWAGNALAMRILATKIQQDLGGDVAAAWQDGNRDLLHSGELQRLVTRHFDDLHRIAPEAYRLLCRLGAYRYQEISHVPRQGVECLLWDVANLQRHPAILQCLRDRSLLECRDNGKFWLHPMMRMEARNRLRDDRPSWEMTHRKLAEFWLNSITHVDRVEEALEILEAYYHYLEISDYDKACDVLITLRHSRWGGQLQLGWLFYRFGEVQKISEAIHRIAPYLLNDTRLGLLLNLCGYIHRVAGDLTNAIEVHQRAHYIAKHNRSEDLKLSSLLNLGLCLMELWHIETALMLFRQTYHLAEQLQSEGYRLYSACCLAYLYACQDQPEAARLQLEGIDFTAPDRSTSMMGRGYSRLFLAHTYRHLHEYNQALQAYQQTICYAENQEFPQIRAKGFHGLAQIYRMQGNLTLAREYHLKAISLLTAIGAKCDLAKAYAQLALTCQQMQDWEEAERYYQQARQMFSDIPAPRRVSWVDQLLDRSPSSSIAWEGGHRVNSANSEETVDCGPDFKDFGSI